MGKPHVSSKWNKKFRKNIKKFQKLSGNAGTEDQNQPSLLSRTISFLPSQIRAVIAYFLNCITFLANLFRQSLGSSQHLQDRVRHLEKELEAWPGKFGKLQQEVEQLKEKMEEISNKHQHSQYVPSSVVPPPPPFPSVSVALPPPPPPPPPPPGLLINQPLKRITPTEKKAAPKPKPSRPSISIEDILNVKLKKTPAVQRKGQVKSYYFFAYIYWYLHWKLSNAFFWFPAVQSLDSGQRAPSAHIIGSSALSEIEEDVVSFARNEPKQSEIAQKVMRHQYDCPCATLYLLFICLFLFYSKINFRQVLRRHPSSSSPGGTPKMSSVVRCESDELTPVMTRALLKRFAAFNISPEEENKENDMQFA